MNRCSAEVMLMLCAFAFGLVAARAAEHLSSEQVRNAIGTSPPDHIDLSEKDLTGEDLTGLDLSGAKLIRANLAGANLHGVKLVGADLTEANLTNADLTFAWFIRANFTRANLRGATLQTVVTSTSMDNKQGEVATFVDADLSNANITVHFSFYDMRRANFSNAHMSVVMSNQSMGLLRTEFVASNLDGANFEGAGLAHVTFRFAKLRGANFRGADVSFTDFTGAYLDGADFSGAKLAATIFESATTTSAKGLDQLQGRK
jgi:uncharacterized protein YjbI with pentapeptide repeats